MNGVLPIQHLRALARDGAITGDPAPEQFQPASLDLTLGDEAIRLRASFLPGDRAVSERLPQFEMHRVDLTRGAVLEKGCVYLVPLREGLALPAAVSGSANAKSSTGRLDLLTRLIVDRGTEFDRIPPGYAGPLYAEICPRSFSVLARTGVALSQMRLTEGDAALDDAALTELNEAQPLLDRSVRMDGGLPFSVDMTPNDEGIAGWRARPHSGVVDLDRRDHDPAEFWEPVTPKGGGIVLDPGAFYILVSREAVRIPPLYAAEMAPYLALAGEFRVHYAGFFDPGFGHDVPARGVLEVRCHEAPFALEHGQSVGRLIFERMIEAPETLYGSGIGSNYAGQGLKLSKHFASP